MKKALLSVFLVSACCGAWAQTSFLNDTIQYLCGQNYHYNQVTSSRATIGTSDTIDIKHFIISLNVTDFANKTIGGNCQVQFKSKMDGTSQLFLDLLRFKIDSITQNGQKLNYLYADSITLHIDLLNTLNTGDSAAVTIYYRGKPEGDNTTFGGFYFQGPFAYNIGVGSNYYPHMLGRAWYPCFDNFVERATYEYYITTANNKRAMCNGEFLGSVDNGNSTITWHWKLNQEIPGYLANISVGPYAPLEMTFNGINGPLPVVLAAAAADTGNMRRSMSHLENAFHTFEEHYGPYVWNRIGYCSVPFANVAMEHATNITYPGATLLGSTAYENLYVHELAHHWFGDIITPRTAEDYWLKEGWAVFSEKLFFKELYGLRRYLDEVATTHEQAVHYGHIYDKSYLPVSPIPQQYTYGKTVYNKASDMAHVMPAYIGDDKMFQCLKSYFVDKAFTDQDSYSFRDYMSQCSGVDLTDYFNDWIFSPGFAHFSVDSFEANPIITAAAGDEQLYHVKVYIRQRLDNAPHYYHKVPLEVTFMDSTLRSVTGKAIINGACTVYETEVPFEPTFVCTDLAEKIQDAITENYDTITATGPYNFTFGKMNLNVKNVPGTTFLRIEHNFIAPDTIKAPVPGLHISQERYWRVDGIIPDGFDASSVIAYNGQAPSTPSAASNYYLDTKLITNSDDSLVVLYRADITDDWKIDTGVVQSKLSAKIGNFTINHLRKGEYALGIYQANKVDSVFAAVPGSDTCSYYYGSLLGAKDLEASSMFTVYPNPTQNNFILEGTLLNHTELEVYNLNGQQLYYAQMPKGEVHQQLNTSEWGSGIFMLRISDPTRHQTVTKKVVVIKE